MSCSMLHGLGDCTPETTTASIEDAARVMRDEWMQHGPEVTWLHMARALHAHGLLATAPSTETNEAWVIDVLDSLPYFTFEDDDVAPDEEFVRKADVVRLLATARPSRDDISDAIEHSGIAIGTSDAERAAEAVLALYADQPTEATTAITKENK